MKATILLLLALVSSAGAAQAQYVFLIPTYYHGVLANQLPSARAQAMGWTTMTVEGVGTSIFNPALLGPDEDRLNVSLNYANTHPWLPDSYYTFVGVSYRPIPRLVLSASRFGWKDPESLWTASIANQDIDTDSKSQQMHTLAAAFALGDSLHVGISGNFLRDEAVEGTTTNRSFMLTLGAVFDRPMDLLSGERFSNQHLRVSGSLQNVLMKGKIEETYETLLNYRDLPVIARLGGAYGFDLPLPDRFAPDLGFFGGSPETLDVTARLQLQKWFDGRDAPESPIDVGTAIGIGAEAWYRERVALRLGFYRETRAADGEPGDIVANARHKQGLTFGLGSDLPMQRLAGEDFPLDVQVNLVYQGMLNEVIEDVIRRFPEFGDNRRMISVGVDVGWNPD